MQLRLLIGRSGSYKSLQIIPSMINSCTAIILDETEPTVDSFETDNHLASVLIFTNKSVGIKNPHISRKKVSISSRL